MECIVPILESQEAFKSLIVTESGFNEALYVDLVTFILYFKNRLKNQDLLMKFSELIKQTLKSSLFGNFLKLVQMKIPNFKEIKPLADLFKYRIACLEKTIQIQPKFNWSMPNAKIENLPTIYAEFESFLKKDTEVCILTGVFTSLSDARLFMAKYQGKKKEYSVRMEEGGSGRGAYVKCTKTREYYDSLCKVYEAFQKEMDSLKALV